MNILTPGEYDHTIDGIRIHYSIHGSGPVLITHSGGPGMDARGWDDFAKIGEFVTVVNIHPRGSGLSDPAPHGDYRLADYAGDLEALRQHLGLDKPIVMGWSHGGMVAQQFAASYPESLSKLILYATTSYLGEFLGDIESAVAMFKDQPWFEQSYAALQKEWAGEYETGEDMAALWADEMKFYFKEFDERAQAYHQRTKDLPIRIESLKDFNELEAETLDLRPLLKKINVPTLVLAGRHDFITTAEMGEEMIKHLPNGRLVVFENSGHFALVEEAEYFHSVIKDFVTSS